MRSQTTCSVSLFSSVHILTVGLRGVGLRGVGLSEVDCTRMSTVVVPITFIMQVLGQLLPLSGRNVIQHPTPVNPFAKIVGTL